LERSRWRCKEPPPPPPPPRDEEDEEAPLSARDESPEAFLSMAMACSSDLERRSVRGSMIVMMMKTQLMTW